MKLLFVLQTYQIIPKSSLYIFLKSGSFSSIVLVRQSFKLCQNASYPRCHPDLNNLERQNTHRKKESSFDCRFFWRGCLPLSPPFSWSIFLYQWWQVSIKPSVAEEAGRNGQWSQGEGRGKKHETFSNNCSRKIPYQCVVWGKEVFSFFRF